ncbi:MAG TPA: 2Fe-2S iron-sulfur cluster-binding protein, partial [Rhizorhapis sp.]|nr:2Fe-2S iron-sulfur cluster-binding protein [Rhizorhapis sp.]
MTYSKQADFGTPASGSNLPVTLTIDGQSVTVPAGSTVMRAAAEIGTSIPKLCATD